MCRRRHHAVCYRFPRAHRQPRCTQRYPCLPASHHVLPHHPDHPNYDFTDDKFFCEWEAPDKGAIEQAFKENEVPYDAIYPVRLFTVATGELED